MFNDDLALNNLQPNNLCGHSPFKHRRKIRVSQRLIPTVKYHFMNQTVNQRVRGLSNFLYIYLAMT